MNHQYVLRGMGNVPILLRPGALSGEKVVTTTTTSGMNDSAADASRPTRPNELRPVLNTRFALQPRHAMACLLWVMVYLGLSYLPVAPGHVWRHILAGRALCEQATSQLTDRLPLAVGRPNTNTTWLSDVLLYQADRFGGPEALTSLLAIAVSQALSLLVVGFFVQTGRLPLALLGVALAALPGWSELIVLQPATFGWLCLAGLLATLVAVERRERIPAQRTFVAAVIDCMLLIGPAVWLLLWANLDSSFLVGVTVLAAWTTGSFVDSLRNRGISVTLDASDCRRRLIILELSLAATLVNPRGVDLWLLALGLKSDVLGTVSTAGGPLILNTWSGALFAFICLAAGVLLRRSRRRWTAADVLLFSGAAVAAAWNSTNLIWLGPIAAFVIMPHVASLCGTTARTAQGRASTETCETQPLQFAYTWICLLLIGVGTLLSPMANRLLGAPPRAVNEILAAQTPIGVGRWLEDREVPPHLVWAEADWSDYLAWRSDIPVMFSTEFALLPRQVRNDYTRIHLGEDWQAVADRYALDAIVIDKQRQRRMTSEARRASEPWQIAYEDEQALVLLRDSLTATSTQGAQR